MKVAPLLALLVLALACEGKAAPGRRCTNEGRYVCGDATTALFCESGTYRAVPCRGARGCTGGDVAPMCDDRAANEGDACMSPSAEGRACSTDHARALVCRAARWQPWRACKGPRACAVVDERVECDATIAEAGDACAAPSAVACVPDGSALLACAGERMAPSRPCRGERGCYADTDSLTIECDDSVAREGDGCRAGASACSVDRTSELACESGRFVRARACTRRGGCAPQRSARPLCVD